MTLRIAPDLELPLDAVTPRRGPTVRTRREDDFSWAAGLFEGEGTVTIARRSLDDTYRLVCTIGMTDREVIEWFVERWGGWFQVATAQPRRRRAWVWTVAGPRAAAFIEDLEPFLRSARVRGKFALAVEFRSSQSSSRTVQRAPGYRTQQRDLYDQMRALNRRGVGGDA